MCHLKDSLGITMIHQVSLIWLIVLTIKNIIKFITLMALEGEINGGEEKNVGKKYFII